MSIRFILSIVASLFLFQSGVLSQNAPENKPKNILEVDSKGKNGRDGLNGQDASQNRPGADSRGFGRAGANGGNAGPATAGSNGWDTFLEVWQEPSDVAANQIRFKGERTNSQTGEKNIIEEQVASLNAPGLIVVFTNGGQGGAGGQPGLGQPGGNAEGRGADATRRTNAESGKDGGDAGDNGLPTPGADGGRGGRVTFAVRAGQEHLVSLLGFSLSDVAGGAGGPGGGRGGKVAPGGEATKGGAGLDQAEFEIREDGKIYKSGLVRLPERPPGDTRDEGMIMQLAYKNVSNPADVIHRDTKAPYRKPPGKDGRPGRDGRELASGAAAGRSGQQGWYGIHVLGPNGRVDAYQSPFSPALANLQIVDQNGDQVFEPGEKVSVRVAVSNLEAAHPKDVIPGLQMSIPAGAVEVRVTEQGLEGDGTRTAKISEVAPGKTVSSESLEYTVDPMNFTVGNQDTTEITITASGFMVGLNRPLQSRSRSISQKLKVQLPIRFEGMKGLRNLKPGEAAWYDIVLSNRTEKDLDVSRALAVALEWTKASLDQTQVVLVDEQMNRIEFDANSTWARSLPPVKGKSQITLRVAIGIKSSASADQVMRVVPSMGLQQLNGSGTSRVTAESFEVVVGGAFDFTPDADVVLVVSSTMAPTEISALQDFIRSLGLKPSIYRLANEAVFALDRKVSSGGTLKDHLSGKTVMLFGPNGAFQPSEFLDAAAQGTNFAIFSDRENDFNLDSILARAAIANAGKDAFRDATQLISQLRSLKQGGEFYLTFIPTDSFTFGSPKEEHIQKAAENILDELSKAYPGMKFEIFYDFKPVRNGGWFADRKYDLGTLKIVRSLDAGASRVMAQQSSFSSAFLNPQMMARPNEVTSGIFRGLNFEQLLKVIDHLQSSEASTQVLDILKVAIDAAHLRVFRELAVDPTQDHLLNILLNANWKSVRNHNESAWKNLISSLKASAIRSGNGTLADKLHKSAKSLYDRVIAPHGRTPFSDIEREARDLAQRASSVSEIFGYIELNMGVKGLWTEANAFGRKSRIVPEQGSGNSLETRAANVVSRKEELRRRKEGQDQDRQKFLIPGGCDKLLSSAKNLAS